MVYDHTQDSATLTDIRPGLEGIQGGNTSFTLGEVIAPYG
jgi:hypothetical protein